MIIEKKMAEAINDQIQAELFSSYLYLAMAADFESKNFKGMAHWMRKQAGEEQVHGMKFFDYLLERGGRVELKAIEQPQTEWASPLEVFEAAYAHEQKVTARIWALADQAGAAGDHATSSLLKWFVDEQVEEEASALEIVEKLKMIGDRMPGLVFLDKELGGR